MTDDPSMLALPFTLRRGCMYPLEDAGLVEMINMLIFDCIPEDMKIPARADGDDEYDEQGPARTVREAVRTMPTMVMFSSMMENVHGEWHRVFDIDLAGSTVFLRESIGRAAAAIVPGRATLILTTRRKIVVLNDLIMFRSDIDVIRDAWMARQMMRANEMARALMPSCWPILLACCELERLNQD